MRVELPIRVEWRGKASSSFTRETIDKRLAVIASRDDDEARREREFLERVKQTIIREA